MHPILLKPGPVKWCSICGRKHPARADCGLVKVIRTAKNGNKVERYAHPDKDNPCVKKSES